MPSKKRKYNARFPAGRIKKIMQTDEEVGKVAQAVPIIILTSTPRTLELFVESLLSKAMQVTMARKAKTLSPSHVKQCILAESRFDFLRDLVKNIPDVSAAEEKEVMSAESSPNSSRFSDATPAPPRRIAREDSNSSSSSDIRIQQVTQPKDNLIRAHSTETELIRPRTETVTSAVVTDAAIDLSRKPEEPKQVRIANFYQETLVDETHPSVITVNPTYSSPQPSTSSYSNLTIVEANRVEVTLPKPEQKTMFYVDVRQNNKTPTPRTPRTPVTPILNIDFTKNLAKPEIKVLDTAVASIVGVPKNDKNPKLQRRNSKVKVDAKKFEPKPVVPNLPVDIDHINSGNLQIDEDYDT